MPNFSDEDMREMTARTIERHLQERNPLPHVEGVLRGRERELDAEIERLQTTLSERRQLRQRIRRKLRRMEAPKG